MRSGWVDYDGQSQRQKLSGPIDELLAAVGAADISTVPVEGMNPFWTAVMAIMRVAPLIKHPGFAEEREWRIYTDPSVKSDRHYDFLVRGDELVPIYKMPLVQTPTDRNTVDIGLRRITTGPGPHNDRRQNAILLAIQMNGVDWQSGTYSTVPYR